MLKKLLTVGLALTMMFAVTACSSKDSDQTNQMIIILLITQNKRDLLRNQMD